MNSTLATRNISLAASLIALSILACAGTGPLTPTADALATSVAETLVALTPLASPTALPTFTPQPTATQHATASANLPAAVRLSFLTGATQTTAQGTILAAQTLHYVVRAAKDQPMIVMVDSPEHDVNLAVFGANGTVVLPAAQEGSGWQGLLPSTQDYYFRLTGGGSTQTFTLNVIIAARIAIAPTLNEATVIGETVGGYPVTYVAYALGGQSLAVTLNTEPDEAALTIWGFSDGQPYARAQNGVTDFSLTLPSTQDYIIQVVPQGGQVRSFQLKIRID